MTLTVYDYAAKYGVTRATAKEFLDNRTRLGMFKKTKVKVGCHWVNHYTLVESAQEPAHATPKRNSRRGRRLRDGSVLPMGSVRS